MFRYACGIRLSSASLGSLPMAKQLIQTKKRTMKNSSFTQQLGWAALTGVALAFSPGYAHANTNYVSVFDTASEVGSWLFDFGSVTHANSFDPTMDGNTNASSGSMMVTFGFSTNIQPSGENKGAYIITLNPPI